MALIRRLLILDTSFSYEAIVERGLSGSVTCRDLNGYFDHVWSVHPFASLVTSVNWSSRFGKPVVYAVNKNHTFIEGKIGRTSILRWCPRINFLLAQLELLVYLHKLVRKKGVDVIRAGDPLYLGLLGYVLSRISKIPFLVRVGANNEKIRITTGNRMMPRLFKTMNQERAVEHFVLTRADLVVGANNDNLKFAQESGAASEKCTLFRYGNLIDREHFVEPSHRLPPSGILVGTSFLLCIARLEPVKKVDDVIRVLAAVRASGCQVKAVLVGNGRERQNLELLARRLGVMDSVVFCGNKSQSWLASVIPQAEVVLSPHTGRALTEAGLGAAPIVAYDIDWQSELIISGVTGEIVPFGDWQELAKRTLKLLQDRDYAKTLGINVRAKTLEMMDPVKLNKHEMKCYDLLLDRAHCCG
jgi:glycosyltransferase involved in cell wall biosynthesis